MNLLPPTFLALILSTSLFAVRSPAATVQKVRLDSSIRAIQASDPLGRRIVRPSLTTDESAAPLNLVVSLQMRRWDELQARLQRGETIPRAEMEERFLPLRSDFARVSTWLTSQGFTITLDDPSHANVFARGRIADAAAALDVAFARVATSDGEFSSAVTAPALPAEFAGAVIGITGLQPETQLRPQRLSTTEVPPLAATAHPTRALPPDVAAAYHVPAGLDGTGQVIAIVGGSIPLASDLAAFYQTAGLSKTPADLIVVRVNGGPTDSSQTSSITESTMDTEWSSAMAPGAQVMLYATPTFSLADLFAACTQILADGKAKTVSHSASAFEAGLPAATLQAGTQIFAQLAAAGITVLHGDGDNGSASGPMYPASDPYVMALSGTVLTFDANWNASGETAWDKCGGGISSVFPRPAWQKGSGMPAGTMRCVPDAGSMSTNGSFLPLVIRNGQTIGVGGSSMTGPVWSALIAMINQARAKVGLPSMGLLGPRLYPLGGTGAFYDITSGANDVYQAGPGYDLVTGLGSLNVGALITAVTAADLPTFVSPPESRTVGAGATTVLRAGVTGVPAPALQWYRNGTAIAGATGSMLVLAGNTTQGGSYTCVATNAGGAVTSSAAALTVASTTTTGRLVNLSILTDITSSAPTFTLGTVIRPGANGALMPLLVRGVGPTLATFGVSGVLTDPKLELFADGVSSASNDNWGGVASLVAAFDQTGAFHFSADTSKDAALFLTGVKPQSYTVQVSGVGAAAGTALAELYDATPASARTGDSPRLVNVSVLKPVAGTSVLTTGFVIAGSTAETVLVRAIGPTLAKAPFNVPGTMSDPQLTVFDADGKAIASNDNWAGDTQLSSTAAAVGAFALPDGTSKDAVLLLTLAPGAYTAQVRDVSSVGGTAIVEVYEVP